MTLTAEYPAAMPAEPAPQTDGIDALTLRALERATNEERARGVDGPARVSARDVAEHIAPVASDGPAGKKWESTLSHTRVSLGTLDALGLVKVHRDHRRMVSYELTKAGNAELRALERMGVAAALPESPAHRQWREQREAYLADAEAARLAVAEACKSVSAAAAAAQTPDDLQMPDDSRTIAGGVEDAVYALWEALAALSVPEPIDPR